MNKLFIDDGSTYKACMKKNGKDGKKCLWKYEIKLIKLGYIFILLTVLSPANTCVWQKWKHNNFNWCFFLQAVHSFGLTAVEPQHGLLLNRSIKLFPHLIETQELSIDCKAFPSLLK